MEHHNTQTARGLAEIASYSPEQQAKLAELFAAFEKAEAGYTTRPGMRFTSQEWKDFCAYTRECRSGRVANAAGYVTVGSWLREYWHGDVGSKWPSMGTASGYFAATWDKKEGLWWTLPAAVVAGGLASKVVHSHAGKSLIRIVVHSALFALFLRPIFYGHRR